MSQMLATLEQFCLKTMGRTSLIYLKTIGQIENVNRRGFLKTVGIFIKLNRLHEERISMEIPRQRQLLVHFGCSQVGSQSPVLLEILRLSLPNMVEIPELWLQSPKSKNSPLMKHETFSCLGETEFSTS